MRRFENFLVSGHIFDELESEEKARFELINNILAFAIFAASFGILCNFVILGISLFFYLDLLILTLSLSAIYLLRKSKKSVDFVANTLIFVFGLFFVFAIYLTQPSDMKHVLLFTYPIILFSVEKAEVAMKVLFITLIFVLLAPLQPFFEVAYSFMQVLYISVVITILALLSYFYQKKLKESKDIIAKQKAILSKYNEELISQVHQKTLALREYNELLEHKVEQKVAELVQKDELIVQQSRQAVMGEMLSMIAHQWRQPLSTITLQISNIQLRLMMGKSIEQKELDQALNQISTTVMYLSDTIEDFKGYFEPQKEAAEILLIELLHKAISFTQARAFRAGVDVCIECADDLKLHTHANELIQILLNLINNALDALMPLQQKQKRIKIYAQEQQQSVKICVWDNGSGIDPSLVGKIFEPYFSTKGKNGTGLGLYMSHMIATRYLGGEIYLLNDEEGTTFCIELKR